MKYGVWFLVVLLLVLHQDYWQWGNATLDLGFLPRALTYHMLVSIVAAIVWMLAICFAWPKQPTDSGSEAQSRESDA